jgi:hypothetical protein
MSTTTFMTNEYKLNNHTYPPGFVTIPDADYHLSSARQDMGACALAYTPIVQSEDRALWETYVKQNLGWLQESWEAYANTQSNLDDIAVTQDNHNSHDLTQIWSIDLYDANGKKVQYDHGKCHAGDSSSAELDTQFIVEDPGVGFKTLFEINSFHQLHFSNCFYLHLCFSRVAHGRQSGL